MHSLKRPNLRREWSTIPNNCGLQQAAAFHNQPSRFAAWRLFVSLAHGSLKSPACSCVSITFLASGWEAMGIERHRRRSPRRLSERERANGASGKRCDIDAAKRRSQTENWEVRVNQSKPKLTHVPECQRLTRLKNRSRREWSRWESTDIDEARRVSFREKANQSKPKLTHVPECQRLTGLKNRSRRESNPHLRFRKPLFYPLNYGNNLERINGLNGDGQMLLRCAAVS